MDTTRQGNFETDTCTRCGGTGSYSYNQMDGTRCYGCSGIGYTLTKAGRAAREAWVAANTVTIPATEVVVGDVLFAGGKKRTVVGIEDAAPGAWFARRLVSGTREDGNEVWEDLTLRLVTKDGVSRVQDPGATVEVWREVIAAPPLSPVVTDRAAEMREYAKAAAAAAAAAGRDLAA